MDGQLDKRSPFANDQDELAFLRQRMTIFDEYQKSAYAAHAAEMKEDGQPPFKGITGYGKRTAALIMMERDELAKQVEAVKALHSTAPEQVERTFRADAHEEAHRKGWGWCAGCSTRGTIVWLRDCKTLKALGIEFEGEGFWEKPEGQLI